MALALQVPTRLWLGGVVAAQRDRRLVDALVQKIRACASRRPLLVCVDGLASYVNAVRRVFRDPLPRNGQTGRRLKPWRGLYLAQVVKQYAKRRVVEVAQRVVQGRRTGCICWGPSTTSARSMKVCGSAGAAVRIRQGIAGISVRQRWPLVWPITAGVFARCSLIPSHRPARHHRGGADVRPKPPKPWSRADLPDHG